VVRYTIERDGFIDTFEKLVQQYLQMLVDHVLVCGIEGLIRKRNTIVHSFNRNFSKRADGPKTHGFRRFTQNWLPLWQCR
jgi:aconitate hydratase